MFEWVRADENTYRIAIELAAEPVRLYLQLKAIPPVKVPPPLSMRRAPKGTTLEIKPSADAGVFDILLVVPKPSTKASEEEVTFTIAADKKTGVPECQILLRRTKCAINNALIMRQADAPPLKPQTKAALLWYSFGRFSELVGLKRFTSGLGGSDVLVFRPRLRNPDSTRPDFVGKPPLEVVSQAWGAPLLIKTGPYRKIEEEWERFRLFLADRIHPFMARSEAFLIAQTPDNPPGEDLYATVLGTFLGGDLLQAEPFQSILRDAADPTRIEQALHSVFSVTATWYAGSANAPISNWWKMLRSLPSGKPGIHLFGKFDLEDTASRSAFTTPLMWDIDFVKREHLVGHLLGKPQADKPQDSEHQDDRDQDGKPQKGLLYRLSEIPVRYSVIHGDLQPRNILADDNNVWLIDFGETCIGPTLFDFTKLEVYVRLWCLDLASTENSAAATREMETLLLDAFTATEASLEPLRALAARIGADAAELLKIARCIAAIRHHASRYFCQETPDRREYLAVLYLTVLNTLRFAGTSTARIENFRWLMALYWVLEDTLSRMLSMEPYARMSTAVKHEHLITPQWLARRYAPRRILYWLDSEDGRRALEPLCATRGVHQGASHHLDVFDHTLLVLAYLEEMLEDPIENLLYPNKLDEKVAKSLNDQGITLPPVCDYPDPPQPVQAAWLNPLLPDLKKAIEDYLQEKPERQRLIKWVALFHDVGKPATRVMTVDEADKTHKTQFFGHEVYGAQLVASRLNAQFPDDNPKTRELCRIALELIRKHHLHHTQVNRYHANRSFLDALIAYITQSGTNELADSEKRYLLPLLDERHPNYVPEYPLLILHGYADMMACRGPAMILPLQEVAEIDLALLAFYFLRYPTLRRRQLAEEEFNERTKGIAQEVGVDGPPLGKALRKVEGRFLDTVCPPEGMASPSDPPSRETVVGWVREALEEEC